MRKNTWMKMLALMGGILLPGINQCTPPEDDQDADGITIAQGDCDDHDPMIYPGAADAPDDSTDSDCGGTVNAEPSVGLNASTYTTIQSAIEAAQTGTTVWVGEGTFAEHGISLRGKAITVRSVYGPDKTIIDAEFKFCAVLITSGETTDTTLQGFTITRGWGIDGYGGGVLVFSSGITLRDITLIKNDGDRYGGGIYAYHAQVTMSNVLFENNTAQYNGGALAAYYSSITGMGVGVVGNTAEIGSGFYLVSTNLSLNYGDFGNTLESYSIDPNPISELKVENSNFSGLGVEDPSGPLVLMDNAIVEMSGTTIEDGSSGGMRITNSHLYIVNSTVQNNTLYSVDAAQGAGLAIFGSQVEVEGSTFEGNRVVGEQNVGGGGVYSQESSLVMNDAVIRSNTAERSSGEKMPLGGGIATSDGTLTMTNCRIESNQNPVGLGGGLFVGGYTVATLNQMLIAENATDYFGGGVYVSQFGSMTCSNCLIVHNHANLNYGGGIYQAMANVELFYSVIAYNSAAKGSGVYAQGSYGNEVPTTLKFDHSIVAHNTGSYSVFATPGVQLSVSYSDFYGGQVSFTVSGTSKAVDPEFLSSTDYHLALGSPLINVGSSSQNPVFDPDGSACDMGLYSGPNAGTRDMDGDGTFDYFWPGTIDDEPAGFDDDDYDRDDNDPTVD